ncbi:MAG: aminotransferase class V-fold PLP-dependent enzyme, partial [Bacteroidota bacterium]
LNLLATGLKWKVGDRVLLNDMEFPANVYPFLNLKRLGVEIDFVRNRDGRLLLGDIERTITPRTRLLSISHVQFFHGSKVDLEALGVLCASKGIIFCVDAIQAAGVTPIEVHRMKIDFLACGGQKWLMAPQGIAFVYLTEELQSRLEPAYLGWTSIKDYFSDFFRYRLDLQQTAQRYENGALNFLGIAGLHASLSTLLEIGIENIERHVHSVTQHLIDGIRPLGLPLITPEEATARAGILTFRVPNGPALFETLQLNNIQTALREGCIRISPHFYNTIEEIDRTMEVVGANLNP